MTADPPTPRDSATADSYLSEQWHELMNGAGPASMAYVKGAIWALWATGQLTNDQRELWQRRIMTCPENTADDPGHIGGRGWCAYCGDCADATARLKATADRATPKEQPRKQP